MVYSIAGTLIAAAEPFVVVETGGLGLKVFVNNGTRARLPNVGEAAKLYTHLHAPEGGLDLYGFLSRDELEFFELLLSVSGIGPKSALSVLDVADLPSLKAAVAEGRPDLLSKASGVGGKTAQRIIIELRNKVSAPASADTVKRMETDADLIETLVGLGYRKEEAKRAIAQVDEGAGSLEARLKAALNLLSKR